jgi:hypothetical protein
VSATRREEDPTAGVREDLHGSHLSVQTVPVAHPTLEQLLLQSDFGRLNPKRARELAQSATDDGGENRRRMVGRVIR